MRNRFQGLRKTLHCLLITCYLGSFYAPASLANITFPEVTIETLNSELQQPWSLTELPSREWLVTLKAGQILMLDAQGKELTRFTHMPKNLYVAGQGGLMDIKLHPNFALQPYVYISYAEGNEEGNRLAIARATLYQQSLGEWQTIFRVSPDKPTPVHYGARMAFLPDGSLLITSGDGFDFREQAQVKSSNLGKVLRMSDEGQALSDNPFYTGAGSPIDYVYTLGHRNPQGLVVDEQQGTVYLNEHGPAGGDEINVLQAGENYGWPVVTWGKDYSGANISPFDAYPGMRPPVVNWTPSIAPSSMVQIKGPLFAQQTGDFLVTSLAAKRLYWVRLGQSEVLFDRPVVESLQTRLRDIQRSRSGAIFILTDGSEASLLKMVPK
ncbi:PQQ-dependent sugar dehydrogenase [Alteromonas flava]|uniref:PQQ-dependent sugar dehydrogenase n=1 Tax=Alteromonas flava TaxID=2048003 RepID=UPI0013D93501|nr:PQQ-dependent sugar dehydrogenase [Alteromonas flava]